MSFFGKILIDARPAAHRDVPRELTWSTDDIAAGVDNGELIVLDPRERVVEQWSKANVSLAQAFANRMNALMPRLRYGVTKPVPKLPSKSAQALLLRLAKEGDLTQDEIRALSITAVRAGAGDAFLGLTASWPKGDRADTLRSELTYAADDQVSLILASVFIGLNQVIRALISEGLDPNEKSESGQSLGHFLAEPELLKDLRAAGLDANAVDEKGVSAKAYWAKTKLTNAKQKVLTDAWDRVFSEDVNPDRAKEALISEIEGKSKTLVQQQLKDAAISPGEKVDGRYLTEHASRSLFNRDRGDYVRTNSGVSWLMTQIPKQDRPEQKWFYSLAHGLSSSRVYEDNAEAALCRANSALRQLERMDRIGADIERLMDPKDRMHAWEKVYYGARGDSASGRAQKGLFVDDARWRAWWMQNSERGIPRILEIHEDHMAGLLSRRSNWEIAESFFSDIEKLPENEFEALIDALTPHPVSGMGAWITFAFCAMHAISGCNSHNFKTSSFQASFYMLYGAESAAMVLDALWKKGHRPNAAQTSFLIQLFEGNPDASKDAAPELAKHLISVQTTEASGRGSARRL